MAEISTGGPLPSFGVQGDATFVSDGTQRLYIGGTFFGSGSDAFTITQTILVETDTARKLGLGRPVGQASETDEAFALTMVQVGGSTTATVGLVVETDAARALVAAYFQSGALTQVEETDEAFTLAALIDTFSAPLGLVTETDSALHLTIPGSGDFITLGMLEETDDAMSVFVVTAPEVVLTLLTPVLNQAPGNLDVTISGGASEQVVDILIDGTLVLTVTLDTDGNLGPFSVPVDNVLGTQGSHTITATTASASFEILLDPQVMPQAPPSDEPPVVVPEALVDNVRKWVFQDLVPEGDGGIGSWVLPYNPKPTETEGPFPVKAFTSKHTTGNAGKWHIFQGQTPPKEWNFGGYLPRQEHIERLMEFRNLNRRFYIIDHRNRAWQVVLTNVDIVPRLRHTWVARHDEPLITDWGHDYKVTAVILDPNWVTPA